MKRLGLFVFYDKDGVVDDYVIYLLNNIRGDLNQLVIICNGYVNPQGREKLEELSDKIYVRDNIGFDEGAYKDVLLNQMGWESVYGYDELILFNATFFGPFIPFCEIFESMECKGYDFWGLMKHGNTPSIKEHIQSYFLVVCRDMLLSSDFREYWEGRMDELETADEVIADFEISFTQTFGGCGYKWGVYVDSSEFDDDRDWAGNFNHYAQISAHLLKEYRMPILKKKIFPYKDLRKTSGEELPLALTYIDHNTAYDIDMIYRHIIRVTDPNLLKQSLNLNYVISSKKNEGQMPLPSAGVAIVAFLSFPKCLKESLAYLKRMPESCHIYLYLADGLELGDEEVCPDWNLSIFNDSISQVVIDISDYLIDNYKYACILHDVYMDGNAWPVGKSLNYNIWENLLKDDQYVLNVIDILEENQYMGLLCPPVPFHDSYLIRKYDEWLYDYEEVKSLLTFMKANCCITEKEESISTEFSFWCKTEILKLIADQKEAVKDFAAQYNNADNILSRCLVYLAQHEGLMSGELESDTYAAIQIQGLSYLLAQGVKIECENKKHQMAKLNGFCKKYRNIYLYGAGKIGKSTLDILTKMGIRIKGFVVSDDKRKDNEDMVYGYPVLPLSDVADGSETGIIVALGKKFTNEAKVIIDGLGLENIYYINTPEGVGKKEISTEYHEWLKQAKGIWNKSDDEIKVEDIKMSIVIAIEGVWPEDLLCLLRTIKNQEYSNWEAIAIYTGKGTEDGTQLVNDDLLKDKRISLVEIGNPDELISETRKQLGRLAGEYVMFITKPGRLPKASLSYYIQELKRHPDYQFIYGDEDKWDELSDVYFSPDFKPDFNFDLFRSKNYLGQAVVLKHELISLAGGLNSELPGAEFYDLFLRCAEKVDVHHIPRIVYHNYFGEYHNSNVFAEMRTRDSEIEALQRHYHRCGITVEKIEEAADYGVYHTTVAIEQEPLVSVVIPNKDHYQDLKLCIHSLLEKTDYTNMEIIVVENNSILQETFDYYEILQQKYDNIRVVQWDKGFNYSAINNFGVKFAKGEYLLLANNDIEIISPDTIRELVGYCQREEVGIVGAKLLYEDNRIQHAGVILGLGGVAGHAYINLNRNGDAETYRIMSTQEYGAVTAAFLMTKKSVYNAVGGLDEDLAVAFNDIDYCMKVRQIGKKIIYNPYALLYHYESKSRGYEDTPEKEARFNREVVKFLNKWESVLEDGDSFYNPNLSLIGPTFALRKLDMEAIGSPYDTEKYYKAVAKLDKVDAR